MSTQPFSITRRFQKTIYIQFTPERITVTCVEDQRTVEDVPLILLNETKHIVAFGAQARHAHSNGHLLVNPFTHPRMCISDFDAAEATVRIFVRSVLPRSLVKPAMIVHPLLSYEGGLTQIEIRALSDLLLNIGAKQTYVWVGRPLTETELRQLQFPSQEGTVYERVICA